MDSLEQSLPEPLQPVLRQGRRTTNQLRREIRKSPSRLKLALAGYRIHYRGLRFFVNSPGIGPNTVRRLRCGNYEVAEIDMAVRFLDPALPAIELGGNMGVVACITNRLLRRPDQHIVVEPNPLLHDVLRRNRDLNQCAFKVVEAALCYDGATGWLKIAGLGSCLTADADGSVSVKAVTLADLLALVDSLPISLISDIEGTETALIREEGALLARHVARFIFEAHPGSGESAMREMMRRLADLGFEPMDCCHNTYAFRNRALTGIPARSF